MDITKMSLQQIFDHAVTHLRGQGRRSLRDNSFGDLKCAYRGDGGMKCAVGAFIDDGDYHFALEGKTCWHPSVIAILTNGKFCYFMTASIAKENNELETYDKIELLSCLQDIHDNTDPSEWEEHLSLLSEGKNLKYKKLEV